MSDAALHVEEAEVVGSGPKLPGSTAATVKVEAFLNSMPRWILKMKGHFGPFFSSMLQFPCCRMKTATFTYGSALWPMPLPFPEVFKQNSSAGRCDGAAKRLVCLQIAVLDWLTLSGPLTSPDGLRLGSKLSAAQWRVVKNLMNLNVDGNTPNSVDAAKMGRAASKFESSQDVLGALARAAEALQLQENLYLGTGLAKPDACSEKPYKCGKAAGSLKRAVVQTARPLIADRLTFPGPPVFHPQQFLDPVTRDRYDRPLDLSCDPAGLESEVPAVKIFADRFNMVEVYRKLAESGRLEPLSVSVKRGPFQSGLFAVVKDQTRDRMVLDGRPPNALEQPQNKWCRAMASPVALAMMHLKPQHVLRCSGEDLRDFFYQFAVPEQRTVRNMLVAPVSAEEASYIFQRPFDGAQQEIYVGLSSLAMGDCMACEYAQGAHTGVLLQKEIATPDRLISLRQSLPRGMHHVGVIIDDLVIFQQILTSDLEEAAASGTPTWGAQTALKARQAYADVGLETNPKKAFSDAACASFWGIDIDGDKGIMRAANSRLWPAMFITMRIASLRLATVGLLEALAGTWVSIFGVRRRLFCLLQVIFEPLGIEDQSMVIRLSDELVDELVCLTVMAPLAMINLRAAYAPFMVATDASLSGMGGVKAEFSSAFSEELCRHALKKSSWAILLPPGKSRQKAHGVLDPSEELPDDFEYSVHPLWELCARSCKFKTTWKAPCPANTHINVLEMRAHMREERRLCRALMNMRIPTALDSQVVLGAVIKGRASSTALNKELRRNLGYPIGNDLYEYYMFFPSAMNRADGPSRGAAPLPPDLPLPSWWDDAMQGLFGRMDVWLRHAMNGTVDDELPYDELMGAEHVDLQPNRKKQMKPMERRAVKKTPAAVTGSCVGPSCNQCVRDISAEVQTTLDARSCAGRRPYAGPDSNQCCDSGCDDTKRPCAGHSCNPCSDGNALYAPSGHSAGPSRNQCSDGPSVVAEASTAAARSCAGRSRNQCSERAAADGKILAMSLQEELKKIPRSQFYPPTGQLDFSVPGALDLFSGSYGVAKQLVRHGCPWVLTYEILHSPEEDLLAEGNQQRILRLLHGGAFLGAGMAPVCASFSRAVTPAVRNVQFPRGLPNISRNMKEKVKVGNMLADFCKTVWIYCLASGISFWCEQPDTSFMWKLKGWDAFADAGSAQVFRASFCRFGTPWRKNTRVATNSRLAGVRMLCQCKVRGHQRLRGYSRTHRAQWTKMAEPYPRGFSVMLAKAVAVDAGWMPKGKLNLAGCAHVGSLRVGEATNPGPSRSRSRMASNRDTLEGMPLLMPATLAMEKRLLQEFVNWCLLEIHSIRLDELFAVAPEVLVHLLKTYGDLMFQKGGSLSNLRRLLLAAQRWQPRVRTAMQPAWDLVAKWERHQPVRHRTPTPEAVVRAMCSLGWNFKWYGWCLAVLLAFYGGGRIGEVLKCNREDLLLPCDLAEEDAGPVFLRLRFFKTKFRNPAQVQHLRLVDETTCLLLTRLFKGYPKEANLFNTNPYQFRKRWNMLLEILQIPASADLTPGGLRGGFAVNSYRSGMSIQNIMWAMRLRSQVTLESYLQEAASLNSLASMNPDVRFGISAASKLFPFLPCSSGFIPG